VGHGTGVSRISKNPDIATPITEYGQLNGFPAGGGRVFRDREGTLWFPTFAGGITKLVDEWTTYFPLSGVIGYAVQDHNGHIWVIANALREVWRTENGTWRIDTHRSTLSDSGNQPVIPVIDPQGRLIVASRPSGLARFSVRPNPESKSSLVNIPFADHRIDTAFSHTWFITVDRSGKIWGTKPSGWIYSYDPAAGDLRSVFTSELVSTYRVLLPRDGNVWFGKHTDGIRVMKGTTLPSNPAGSFMRIRSLPDEHVRAMYESHSAKILIGTLFGGLAIIDDKGSVTTVSTNDGLPSNQIWSIAEDTTTGRIWVGTSQGLCSIDRDTALRVQHLAITSGKTILSCGVLATGEVWALDYTGITITGGYKEHVAHEGPPVFITGLRVNGIESFGTDTHEFSHDRNHCEVEFIGVSFKGEQPVRYQYKLIGIDADWHEPSTLRRVTFAALRPGTYAFEVRALDADNAASRTPASLTFTILPPFWLQWWFLAASGAALVAIVWLIFRARVRHLLAMERVRSRIATDLHDDIGASLTRITLFSTAAQEELRKEGARAATGDRLFALLQDISNTSRDLVDAMSDVVWAVDPRNDSFDNLLLRMKTYAGRLLEARGMEYDIDFPGPIGALDLPLDFRRNMFLVFKEALNNAVRHSQGTTVQLSLSRNDGFLVMKIRDNGRGFDVDHAGRINGLRNMKKRAEQIGGTLTVDSVPAGGTTILLRARLP
jgi:signal transduction histidine kinase/streptogramin lyase